MDLFRVSLVNLLHFSSASLSHVSLEKFSLITLNGSLFVPSGFVSYFLSENFRGFYSSVNLLHFSLVSSFHVSSAKILMDFDFDSLVD